MRNKYSIVMPAKDEEKYLRKYLPIICEEINSLSNNSFQLILIDGYSKDKTKIIFEKTLFKYKIDYLIINNPGILPAKGLNKAIRKSKYNSIIRLDCHTIYPENYLRTMINNYNSSLKKYKTEFIYIGPSCVTITEKDLFVPKSIAIAMNLSITFGANNFRIIKNENIDNLEQSNTAPFGIFSKKTFKIIKGYNEELYYSEDDEFCAKIIQKGGYVLLDRKCIVKYLCRSNFLHLFIQFFNYGQGKTLRLIKEDAVNPSLRFLIPLLFYSSEIIIFTFNLKLSLFLFLLYIFTIIFFIFQERGTKNIKLLPLITFSIVLVHFSYAFGTFSTILLFLIGNINRKIKK